MINKILCIFLYTLAFISLANAEASEIAKPSFDCAKAKSEVEKMVCGDSELAWLDSMMAKEYLNLKKSLNEVAKKNFYTLKRYG